MSAQPVRRTPIRSCVVCRQTSDKRKLLRVVRLPEEQNFRVVVDKAGKMSGRGAYVCPDTKCINAARLQKQFERSLKVEKGTLGSELFDELLSLAEPATAD
jgi:predicted RNA-binding protein YlxR (DUF448 family)